MNASFLVDCGHGALRRDGAFHLVAGRGEDARRHF